MDASRAVCPAPDPTRSQLPRVPTRFDGGKENEPNRRCIQPEALTETPRKTQSRLRGTGDNGIQSWTIPKRWTHQTERERDLGRRKKEKEGREGEALCLRTSSTSLSFLKHARPARRVFSRQDAQQCTAVRALTQIVRTTLHFPSHPKLGANNDGTNERKRNHKLRVVHDP